MKLSDLEDPAKRERLGRFVSKALVAAQKRLDARRKALQDAERTLKKYHEAMTTLDVVLSRVKDLEALIR